jgi:DNA-binding NarL/FixJ family response regulator
MTLTVAEPTTFEDNRMRTIRLLLVDDHEGFINSAVRLLRSLPWVEVCGKAFNGVEAVRLAEELKPDAILMDLSMPQMGGLQATRLIKAQDSPPFIAITSHYDDAEHREHVARAGADAFVSKMWYVHEIVPLLKHLAGVRDDG